jgi:hypothetical protein
MEHRNQQQRSAVLLATAVLLSLVALTAAQSCPVSIPRIPGIDQSPTNPADWGKCTSALEGSFGKYSHWCKFGRLGMYPTPPTEKARQCLKFGRASIYRGPIYGSSVGHLAACNRILRGNDDFAMVAVSTKYLKTYQGGWTSNRGACHQCMCIRLQGADNEYNKGLQTDSVDAHRGLTFLGKVRAAGAGAAHVWLVLSVSVPYLLQYSTMHTIPSRGVTLLHVLLCFFQHIRVRRRIVYLRLRLPRLLAVPPEVGSSTALNPTS